MRPAATVSLAAAGLVVFATGFALTRFGRPYGTALLTVHKLVALGAVVWIGVTAFRAGALRGQGVVAAALAAVLALALFATGGVLRARPVPDAVVWAHRLAPWAALATAAWLLRLTAAA